MDRKLLIIDLLYVVSELRKFEERELSLRDDVLAFFFDFEPGLLLEISSTLCLILFPDRVFFQSLFESGLFFVFFGIEEDPGHLIAGFISSMLILSFDFDSSISFLGGADRVFFHFYFVSALASSWDKKWSEVLSSPSFFVIWE